MRIILNVVLPSNEELECFAEMGIDVSDIANQYYGRHYYIETNSDAFKSRTETVGRTGTKMNTIISFHGVDAMTIERTNLFSGNVSIFKLNMDSDTAKALVQKANVLNELVLTDRATKAHLEFQPSSQQKQVRGLRA